MIIGNISNVNTFRMPLNLWNVYKNAIKAAVNAGHIKSLLSSSSSRSDRSSSSDLPWIHFLLSFLEKTPVWHNRFSRILNPNKPKENTDCFELGGFLNNSNNNDNINSDGNLVPPSNFISSPRFDKSALDHSSTAAANQHSTVNNTSFSKMWVGKNLRASLKI